LPISHSGCERIASAQEQRPSPTALRRPHPPAVIVPTFPIIPPLARHREQSMKEGSHRPVLLVGSVPLKPASEVFRVATHYLGEVTAGFPDGEQVGGLPGGW